MPNIVKLPSVQARAWYRNAPMWVNPTGHTVRPVTTEEQSTISKAMLRVKRIGKSGRQTLHVLEKIGTDEQGREITQRKPTDAIFEVAKLNDSGGTTVYVYVDGNRYVTGKELLGAQLLAEHGECVLHGPNGKCVAVLRDPMLHKKAGATMTEVKGGLSAARLRAKERQALEATARQQTVAARKQERLPRTYRPQDCPNDCRGLKGGAPYALPKGHVQDPALHHPICQYAQTWAAARSKLSGPVMVLFDLDREKISRVATDDEIRQAIAARKLTGAPSVTVGGRLFAVIDRAELDDNGRLTLPEPEILDGSDGPHVEPFEPAEQGALPAKASEDPEQPAMLQPQEIEQALNPLAAGPPAMQHQAPAQAFDTLDEIDPPKKQRPRPDASAYLARPSTLIVPPPDNPQPAEQLGQHDQPQQPEETEG